MKFHNYNDAVAYILRHIPEKTNLKFPGDKGLLRAKYLMQLLGDPQETYQIIHIAGTSGKGSTAYTTSSILHALGFKTGMFVSPHVADIRERCQINNKFLDQDIFVKYVAEVAAAVEEVKKTDHGIPTYFEILDALAFLIFAKEKVEYAVVETGVGGLYDATNVVTNPKKINVITQLGYDHMNVLGNTLSEIAYNKAMISHPGNTTIVLDTTPEAKQIFVDVEKKQQATFIFLTKPENITYVKTTGAGTSFSWHYNSVTWNHIQLSLTADHQADNAALALTACFILSQRENFIFDEQKIRSTLKTLFIPGRIEHKKIKNKDVIIDTAHNPQKMGALITTLQTLFPNEKFTFLLAFKEDKDIHEILKLITPVAKNIWVTSFSSHDQDFLPAPIPPETIASELKDRLHFNNTFVENNPHHAYQKAFQEDGILVITGSFYLVSQLYQTLV